MKTTNFKTLFAVLAAGLLSAATLISSQSPASVLAFEKKTGQDVAGKNCERKDTPGSSTFGKCENVCKDKEVTRDAPNNRWVCSATKTVVRHPIVEKAPINGKLEKADSNPNPKQQPQAGSKNAARITNVRANANGLPAGTAAGSTPVVAKKKAKKN